MIKTIVLLMAATALTMVAAERPGRALEAASPADDLIGEWAPDCARGAADGNVHVEFRRENDQIVRLAWTDQQRSAILVRSVSAETGVIHLAFGRTDRDVVRLDADYVADTSMRTMQSVLVRAGQPDLVAISAGRLTANGQPSETLFKCHPDVSARVLPNSGTA